MNTFATIGFAGVSRVRYARFYIKTGEEELTDYPPFDLIRYMPFHPLLQSGDEKACIR